MGVSTESFYQKSWLIGEQDDEFVIVSEELQ
jgi:hypothetical protein